MTAVAFNNPGLRFHMPLSTSMSPPNGAVAPDLVTDRRMSSANEGIFMSTTVILRKLPRNTTNEAVRTMLLFAKDLQDTEIIPNEFPEDNGFVTALARFSSGTSAAEVRGMLDGKQNTAGQASMIVEILPSPVIGSGRRNTIDPSAARGLNQPTSPPPASQPQHKASRFNGTFQTIEKMSPPPVGSPPDQQNIDSNTHMHKIFSPKSPNHFQDRTRITGKSVIGEDGADDETGELLKDPLAYINGDNQSFRGPQHQHQPGPRLPISGFSALSLNTNMGGAPAQNYASPRSAIHPHTPNGPFTPGGQGYQGGNQYLRHNYPPVNPADQNPPCNTLYVGNLPMDTSEDELKAMFSKQRGYKRLCFRTKQNGPMCFVEFEDVSFATKALNELYGVQLHNSVKGGIRLSFSKNPLGVRSGQPGSSNPSAPLSPATGVMSPMSPGGFSTANGPPPGLSAPPGLNSMSPALVNNHFGGQGFPAGNSPLPSTRGNSMGNGNGNFTGGYPDYMLGR